jgi:hypothetical protein
MSDLTGEKIEQSIKDRKSLHLKFMENVKSYGSFIKLERIAFSEGALKRNGTDLRIIFIQIM